MSDVNLDDYEYMTPQQASEARAMKAELPLWQEMEAMPDGELIDVTDAYFAGKLPERLDEIAQHRALNGTQGMESEE